MSLRPAGFDVRPRLARKARLQPDRLAGRMLLLYPERGLLLNPSAVRTLALCDGARTLAQVIEELAASHAGSRAAIERDVQALLDELSERGLIVWDGP